MLIATALTALVLLGTVQLLRVSLASVASLLRHQQLLSYHAFLETEIRRGIERGNAYYGVPGVNILSADELRAHTQEAGINLSQNLRPLGGSDSLAFLVLDLSAMLSVHSDQSEGPQLRGCFPQGRNLRDSWLAISLDGYEAVRMDVKASKSVNSCAPLRYLEGRMRSQPRIPKAFSHKQYKSAPTVPLRPGVLLPIIESYAIYLAENGELRRLSFTTAENQPLLRDCEELRIEAAEELGVLNITTKLNCKHAGSVRINASSRIVSSGSWMDLLL